MILQGLYRVVLVGVVTVAVSASGIALVEGTSAVAPSLDAFLAGIGGDRFAIAATARAAVPILLCGIGAGIAFRAGLFDLGQPAQFVVGGITAGALAPVMPGPGFVVICTTLAAGALAGAAWAYGVGALALATGIALIIVSLVANYLADGISQLLTSTILQDPSSLGVYQTRPVPPDAELPILVSRTSLHAGVLIALAVWLLACIALGLTVWGHRLRLFGLNPRFAALAGTSPQAFSRGTLAIGGSACGLAGAIEVVGFFGYYQDGTLGGASSPAWMGLTLAVLVPASAVALLPGAILLAGLQTGFAGVQRSVGVTGELALVVQALILIGVALTGQRTWDRRGRIPRFPLRRNTAAPAVRAAEEAPT